MGVDLGLMTIGDKAIDAMLASPSLSVNLFHHPFPLDNLEKPILDLADEVDAFVILNKPWQLIHYLLANAEGDGGQPLDFLAVGGHPIREVYYVGPGRAFRAPDAAKIGEALRSIDEAFLRSRYELERMKELAICSADSDQDSFDEILWCLPTFRKLKRVAEEAVTSRSGLVIFEF